MTRIIRTLEATSDEDYLTLGDLRALVALAADLDDSARVITQDLGPIDHLQVEEIA